MAEDVIMEAAEKGTATFSDEGEKVDLAVGVVVVFTVAQHTGLFAGGVEFVEVFRFLMHGSCLNHAKIENNQEKSKKKGGFLWGRGQNAVLAYPTEWKEGWKRG
jgi:hypothetical protein